MNKVVLFDQYGTFGGGQRVLLEIARTARDHFSAVTVCIPSGEVCDALRKMDIAVSEIDACDISQYHKGIKDFLVILLYTVKILFTKKSILSQASLLYCNAVRILPGVFIASLILRKHAVYHVHLHYQGMERYLLRLVLCSSKTRAIIVPSVFVLEQLRAFSPAFHEPRVIVLENGLDSRFEQAAFDDRFTHVPFAHVAVVGRVAAEKGQNVLPPLARAFPGVRFHVIGDAAFSDKGYAQAIQANAPANVIFHGWIDDVPAKVREIGVQLCIVPSRVCEAFGLAAIEMSALSCLVAVRDLGALSFLAKKLDYLMFATDEQLEHLLHALMAQSASCLAIQAKNSYTATVEAYAHEAFVERVHAMFARVGAAAACR